MNFPGVKECGTYVCDIRDMRDDLIEVLPWKQDLVWRPDSVSPERGVFYPPHDFINVYTLMLRHSMSA